MVVALSCRWDTSTGCLADPAPGEMFSPLPVLHLVPHESAGDTAPAAGALANGSSDPVNCSSSAETDTTGSSSSSTQGCLHQIPVYKTPERAGVLSSTGQSTNFLMHMRLPMPTGTDAAKWLLQGAAVLCSVDE
jgi:dynein heavy chain